MQDPVTFFPEIVTRLTEFPGNLSFHLVIAFSIAGALILALNHWRSSEFPQGRRMVLGLALLMALRLTYFFTGAFLQAADPNHSALPVVDRTIHLISIILIIWLWAFPEPLRLADGATVLLSLLVLTYMALSLAALSATTDLAVSVALGWDIFALALLGFGALALYLRQPNQWGTGFAALLLLFTGHIYSLIVPTPLQEIPGAIRLAQLAAYPLLFMLPQRFPLPQSAPISSAQSDLTVERPLYGPQPEAMKAFIELAAGRNPEEICRAFARSVASVMLADLCMIVSLWLESGELVIRCGFDLIREQPFPGTSLNESILPVLSAALRQGRPLRLPASSTSPDLMALAQGFGLERVGHLLAAPVPSSDSRLAEGVVLLSPYSNRGWTADDQELLVETAAALIKVARRNEEIAALQEALDDARQKLELAESYFEKTNQENEALRAQLASLPEALAPGSSATAETLGALLEAQEEAQQTIKQLRSEIKRLESQQAQTGEQEPELASGELKLALQEVARLREALERTETELAVHLRAAGDTTPTVDRTPDVIASLIQDLRQPLSSIKGYTDLLLSESVGILGSLQIKFLGRISASVERLQAMIEDLIQLTLVDRAKAILDREQVDLAEIIDAAIASTRAQLSEKHIILRVDLPDRLPRLHADRNALEQILIQLLEKAGAATPNEGEIALHARVEQNGHHDHILMQITDSGGGIPEDQLARLFAPAAEERPTVEPAGTPLAITKALVEAHQGRIWVESETGRGATYSILLPINGGVAPVDEAPHL